MKAVVIVTVFVAVMAVFGAGALHFGDAGRPHF